jgi:hypothetical protein
MIDSSKIMDALGCKNLAEAYKLHGIEAMASDDDPVMCAVGNSDYVKLCADYVKFAAQTEIGTPGTPLIDGQLQVEQNFRLRPYFSRGRYGRPGEFEKIFRSEPVVFNGQNSITSLVCNATYEPHLPTGVDDETKAIVERAHNAILYQRGGMPAFLRNAATAFRIGFAPFELIWADGYLHACAFREQATVERWLFDARQSQLVGAEFRLLNASGYALPANGGTPASERLGLVNIYATGNNVEGVSPIRVIVGIRKLKELLLSITGTSFQKYGVPIAQVVQSLVDASAAELAQIGAAPSVAEVQRTVNQMIQMRAETGPVLAPPPGVEIKYVTPTNQMPDVRPMLDYLDSLMGLVMSNEGATIGNSSVGSYAMASVADNRFLRAAPVYANCIAEFLTTLLRLMVRFNHSDPDAIEVWPSYTFRFAGTQDSSKWAADMQVLVAAQVWTWPDEPRRMAAANMGLSIEAFDNWVGQTSADVSGQQLVPEVPL